MVDVMKLLKVCKPRKYSANEVIFNQGDDGHEMFIILVGRVQVSVNSGEGVSIPVNELKAGDFFGEMSLLEGLPRSATVQALEDTTVIAINEDNFEKVICEEPSLALRIMKGLSRRLRKQNEEISRVNQGKPSAEAAAPGNAQETRVDSESGDDFGVEFELTAPPVHEDYLFAKSIECPVCGKSFEVKMVRFSKLKTERIEPDFRFRYKDFEPLWYSVLFCPGCYYADFSDEFNQVSERDKKEILKEMKTLPQDMKLTYSDPRKFIEVLRAYQLALYWITVIRPDAGKLGKLWLRLAWLFEDVKDEQRARQAARHALTYFKEVYFNQKRSTRVEQDQRLAIILGELCLRLEEAEEGKTYFRRAVVHKGGNTRMNEMAQDRLHQLKGK